MPKPTGAQRFGRGHAGPLATRPVKASDRHPYKPASPAVLEAIETAAALGLADQEVRLLAFPEIDSRTWEERVYHPDANGVIRPVSELWPGGSAPRVMRYGVKIVQMMGKGIVSGGLRMAWSETEHLRLALGEHDS